MINKKFCGNIKVLAAACAALLLCACTAEIEYPEGVDTLPSYSATGTIQTIYDTSARPETQTSVTTPPTTASETTESATETATVSETAEETTAESVTEESVSSKGELSLEDIPDVGISEYYDNTQTMPTYTARETEFSPSIVTDPFSSVSETTSGQTETSAAADTGSAVTGQTVSVDETGEQAESSGVITSGEPIDIYGASVNDLLLDGRISAYSGRKIVSHPYSYYTLDSKYRTLYDKLAGALLKHEDKVTFSASEQVEFEDIFDTYQLIYNDEYRLFYLSPTIEYLTDMETGYVTEMKFSYVYTSEEVDEMREELYNAAHDILSQITPEMSDYEIVKHFHDSIIMSCEYKDEVQNPNNVYGCLVDQQALCQAYSQAFTFLCHQAGIETFVILGVANEPHMWNVVKMDGEYYHIDLTWDDPDRTKNPDSIRYDYFGLTDERIRQLRQVDDYTYKVPEANGTKYQYYYYNNLVADSVEEAKAILEAEVIAAAEKKSSTVQFMCTDEESYEEIVSVLFSNSGNNIITVLDAVKDKVENLFNTESIYHNTNKNTRVVKIFLDYLD